MCYLVICGVKNYPLPAAISYFLIKLIFICVLCKSEYKISTRASTYSWSYYYTTKQKLFADDIKADKRSLELISGAVEAKETCQKFGFKNPNIHAKNSMSRVLEVVLHAISENVPSKGDTLDCSLMKYYELY